MNLLQMSFTGSIFIMLIFLLRLLAVNRLPKSTFLVLWGIAIIRLLIPFSIPSAFSVYSLFNRNAASKGRLTIVLLRVCCRFQIVLPQRLEVRLRRKTWGHYPLNI